MGQAESEYQCARRAVRRHRIAPGRHDAACCLDATEARPFDRDDLPRCEVRTRTKAASSLAVVADSKVKTGWRKISVRSNAWGPSNREGCDKLNRIGRARRDSPFCVPARRSGAARCRSMLRPFGSRKLRPT